MTQMVSRSCPVCTATHATVFAQANIDETKLDAFAFASRKVPEYMHHRLLECQVCDTLYASPVPTSVDLANAYDQAAFDSQDEARLAAKTYAALIAPMMHALPGTRALDIGTGDGAFLDELIALGFGDVSGVEPSAAPIAKASPSTRTRIKHGVFRKQDYPLASYDLITCFQTIEHVDAPMEVCRSAFELLKPGGMLCLVCHNRKAVSARVMGMRSPIFDLEHLQLFSERSIASLLALAGFENLQVRSIRNAYPIQYWTKLAPIPIQVKRPLLRGLQGSTVGAFNLSLPAGNLVAFGTKAANLEL